MSVTLLKYRFDGPFNNCESIESTEGLYVILKGDSAVLEVIDLRHSLNLAQELVDEQNSEDWFGPPNAPTSIAVLYAYEFEPAEFETVIAELTDWLAVTRQSPALVA